MKKNSMIVIIGLLLSMNILAQEMKVVTLPKYYASCIFNFSRYVNWPGDAKNGDFNIAVVGDKKVFDELQSLVNGRTVGTQTMKVIFYKNVNELTGFNHIVYLSAWQNKDYSKLMAKINGKNTLVVTEEEGMIKSGAAFDFVSVDGYMKFEMDKSNIEKAGLQVSSALEKMAYRAD